MSGGLGAALAAPDRLIFGGLMKHKILNIILRSFLQILISLIYSFLVSVLIISILDLDLVLLDKLITIIFVAHYFLPPCYDHQIWN